ncbi:metallophosphoesterase family protein [Turicibacter sanguinis]|uniref:metallophosphoesterase family protein n=1 Tax=Turicibacter sanguinis TaxID=154288 RepID=UPI003A7F5104
MSDRHGNMPSLKFVLHDIEQKPIFCLGDMIGKGSQSKEVVDLYLKKCQVIAKGNWEDFILVIPTCIRWETIRNIENSSRSYWI